MRLLGKDSEGTSWVLAEVERGLLVSILRMARGTPPD
jgi:hypothetical protein